MNRYAEVRVSKQMLAQMLSPGFYGKCTSGIPECAEIWDVWIDDLGIVHFMIEHDSLQETDGVNIPEIEIKYTRS